jgi:hypothetical protein
MGPEIRIDPVARRAARVIMILILLVDAVLLATNWDWFTTPIPKDGGSILGQLLGGSAAIGAVVRLATITVILAITGSILGLMFRGQLLSRFGQAAAESVPPTEPLESIADTDTEIHERLGGLEDAVSGIIEYEKQQQEPDDNS